LIIPRHRPHGKHCLLLSRMRVYWPVGYTIHRVWFGNIFTEPLPSNGHMRHNMMTKVFEVTMDTTRKQTEIILLCDMITCILIDIYQRLP
jgi:hypothetical protein